MLLRNTIFCKAMKLHRFDILPIFCKRANFFGGKMSMNVPNVELLSYFFSVILEFLMLI
jgi:hypothetical protein